MITEKNFMDCIEQLFSYYGKSEIKKSPLAMATWRKILNANLDDTQLITACQRCFAKYSFLPPIEKFVELITGDDEIPAIEDWLKILDYARKFGAKRNMSNADQVEGGKMQKQSIPDLILPPHAEKALTKIGGIQKVVKPSEDRKYEELTLKNLEKEFIELWSKYKRAIAWSLNFSLKQICEKQTDMKMQLDFSGVSGFSFKSWRSLSSSVSLKESGIVTAMDDDRKVIITYEKMGTCTYSNIQIILTRIVSG